MTSVMDPDYKPPDPNEESFKSLKRGLLKLATPDLMLPPGIIGNLVKKATKSVAGPEAVADKMLGKQEELDPYGPKGHEMIAARKFGEASANALGAVFGKGLMSKPPGKGQLNVIFIGPSAKTYDKGIEAIVRDELSKVQKMKPAMSAADFDIFNRRMMDRHRAWVEPVTGKVIQAKPDFTMEAAQNPKNTKIFQDMLYDSKSGKSYPIPAKDIMDARDLEHYPSMADLPISNGPAGSLTSYFAREGSEVGLGQTTKKSHIILSPDALTRADPTTVLRHELGHAMQDKEMLPPGGNSAHIEHMRQAFKRSGGAGVPSSMWANSEVPYGKFHMGDGRPAADKYRALIGERMSNKEMVPWKPFRRDYMESIDRPGAPTLAGSVVANGREYPGAAFKPGKDALNQDYAGIDDFLPVLGSQAKFRPYYGRPPKDYSEPDLLTEELARLLAQKR